MPVIPRQLDYGGLLPRGLWGACGIHPVLLWSVCILRMLGIVVLNKNLGRLHFISLSRQMPVAMDLVVRWFSHRVPTHPAFHTAIAQTHSLAYQPCFSFRSPVTGLGLCPISPTSRESRESRDSRDGHIRWLINRILYFLRRTHKPTRCNSIPCRADVARRETKYKI